jgi:hemoglobin
LILAALVVAVVAVADANDANTAPSVAEQIAGMQAMCAETEEARVQRQSDEALYFRLGGYDRIHELTTEVVRLHFVNPALDRIMVGVNGEVLAKRVADFAASGTGGPQTYTGRSMPAAHEHLHLTDADFLAAGGDIVTAMQSMGYGENEINEFVCILVSLKDQVVLE